MNWRGIRISARPTLWFDGYKKLQIDLYDSDKQVYSLSETISDKLFHSDFDTVIANLATKLKQYITEEKLKCPLKTSGMRRSRSKTDGRK